MVFIKEYIILYSLLSNTLKQYYSLMGKKKKKEKQITEKGLTTFSQINLLHATALDT